MKKYDINYFLDKFTNIPQRKLVVGMFDDSSGGHCALGHCGRRFYSDTDEAQALSDLMLTNLYLPAVALNDGIIWNGVDTKDFGETPKERVINALTLIAAGLHKELQ